MSQTANRVIKNTGYFLSKDNDLFKKTFEREIN